MDSESFLVFLVASAVAGVLLAVVRQGVQALLPGKPSEGSNGGVLPARGGQGTSPGGTPGEEPGPAVATLGDLGRRLDEMAQQTGQLVSDMQQLQRRLGGNKFLSNLVWNLFAILAGWLLSGLVSPAILLHH